MKFLKYNRCDTFRWRDIDKSSFTGQFDMPQIQEIHDVEPDNLVPFHEALSLKNPDQCWFHFYEDDYQFERIWRNPKKYIPILKKFRGGISTDFSMYLDMPRSQQIWNCWRNHTMAYLFQREGLTIIPNVGWSDTESLNWAFDGIPENSVLSISTQGCMNKDYEAKQALVNGLHELIRQKHPEKIVVYGRFPETWKDKFPVNITVHKSFSQEKWGA